MNYSVEGLESYPAGPRIWEPAGRVCATVGSAETCLLSGLLEATPTRSLKRERADGTYQLRVKEP